MTWWVLMIVVAILSATHAVLFSMVGEVRGQMKFVRAWMQGMTQDQKRIETELEIQRKEIDRL